MYPFGTIILNESRVENLSQTARELVISHEVSHRDRNAVWKGAFLGSIVWFAVGVLVLALSVILLLSGASLTGPIGAALLLMASFVVIVRAEETIADLQALRAMGEGQFVSGYKEIGEVSSGSRLDSVMRTLL
jgi:Zn-dependent protease with chaperone function